MLSISELSEIEQKNNRTIELRNKGKTYNSNAFQNSQFYFYILNSNVLNHAFGVAGSL